MKHYGAPQTNLHHTKRTKIMKTLIALATVSLMAVSGASALSFGQVDAAVGQSDEISSVYAGDGFVSYDELRNKTGAYDRAAFDAADADGNGKLTPTEFKNLG